ncbi:hypothetical protein [Teichococcus aestuarii]|uniref:hypothetical protein n=1 Tax=Teichococcus aestuarii TaxID=568898 RepID=UPI003621DA27
MSQTVLSPPTQAGASLLRTPERVIPVVLDLGRPLPQMSQDMPEEGSAFLGLCAAMLRTTPGAPSSALRAMEALRLRGWRSAGALGAQPAGSLESLLREAGYKGHAAPLSRRLHAMAAHLAECWEGTPDALRLAANGQVAALRRLLRKMPGLGKAAVDSFCQDMQLLWTELYPFAEPRALRAARRLRLGGDAAALAGNCPPEELPRLAAALAQIERQDGYTLLTRRLSA